MTHEEMFDEAEKFYEVHMLRMRIVAFIIGFASATLLMVAASRAEEGGAPPLLREQIVVPSGIVTLGHLFENAGDVADRAVFRAPDLGDEGVISAARVQKAAARHGLNWQNLGGIKTVSVMRDSKRVNTEEQMVVIRKALAARTGAFDSETFDVKFEDDMGPIHLELTSRARPIVKSLKYNSRSGQFRAVLGMDAPNTGVKDRIVRGRALETVLLNVPKQPIQVGATIQEDDLKILRLPKAQMRKGYATELGDILGQSVKRKLVAGRPIRLSDLEEPKLVRKNNIVDLLFERRGLSLKAEGRALEDGSLGDTIKVMNTHSRKTVVATVVGSGVVSVTGPRTSSRSQQFSFNTVEQQARPSSIENGWGALYSVR